MPTFTAGTSFTDGVTGDVTASKLNALVANATPLANLVTDRTSETSIADDDLVLISDTSESGALNKMTVANLMKAELTGTINSTAGTIAAATIPTLTAGTTTGTAATFTTGTITTGVIPTLTAGTTIGTAATFTTGTITTGVIPTLTAGTTTSTAATIPTLTAGTTTGTSATFTSGTITTLNSTTGTITNGVIPTLTSTTLITSGTGTATAPAIVPTGDTNTGAFFPAADTVAISTAGSERLRIDSSGRVGIGTSSPQKELQLNATEPTIRLEESSAGSKRLELSVNSAAEAKIFANQSGGTLILGTVGTERLRITSDGNVLAGTTDSGLSSGVGFKIQYDNGSTIPRVGVVINATGDSNYHLYNTNATYNGYRFYVSTNGGIANYSANNSNLSDARLKTDIVNAGDYLEKICSIPVRTFKYKDQGDDNEKTVGIIAQEVEQFIPELINNDGFGETPSDGIPYKTIYQTDLQYVLMKCIQELKAENDSLKTRIAALEAA